MRKEKIKQGEIKKIEVGGSRARREESNQETEMKEKH